MSFLSALKNGLKIRNWYSILLCLLVVSLSLNTLLFYPGYMSPDTIDSLGQALGAHALHDWHPVYFVFLWKALIAVTGTPASMLLFSLLLEWLVWGSLAIFIYRTTRSRKLSLVPILLGFAPIVLTVSGVVWKDVLMANFLAVGFIIGLWLRELAPKSLPKGVWWVLFAASLACFVSAALLRYNVIPALIPLVWFLYASVGRIALLSKVKFAGIVAGSIAVIGILSFTLPTMMRAVATNPVNAVMFDDIVHITKKEGWNRDLSPELHVAIENTTEVCKEKDIVFNAYIVCTTQAERNLITKRYPYEIKQLWVETVFQNLFSYAVYRVHAFSLQLIAPDRVAYVWQEGIIDNTYGQRVASTDLQAILKLYVLDFGYRYFPFLFAGWFWILVAGVLLYCARTRQPRKMGGVVAVLVSGVLYVFAYIPITVAADYRYIYWLVLSCLIAGVLLVASRYSVGKKARVSVKIKPKQPSKGKV